MGKDTIKPEHYKVGGLETIKILKAKMSEEEFKGFLKGNVIKYITRADHKNGAEDYMKAQWYINELVKLSKEENKDETM